MAEVWSWGLGLPWCSTAAAKSGPGEGGAAEVLRLDLIKLYLVPGCERSGTTRVFVCQQQWCPNEPSVMLLRTCEGEKIPRFNNLIM